MFSHLRLSWLLNTLHRVPVNSTYILYKGCSQCLYTHFQFFVLGAGSKLSNNTVNNVIRFEYASQWVFLRVLSDITSKLTKSLWYNMEKSPENTVKQAQINWNWRSKGNTVWNTLFYSLFSFKMKLPIALKVWYISTCEYLKIKQWLAFN